MHHLSYLEASVVGAVRFLTRYFGTGTLTPFAIDCGLAGAGGPLWLVLG